MVVGLPWFATVVRQIGVPAERQKRSGRAGLVNRTSDKHVFATRAAVRMVQVVGHGVI